jgi:hypothetical protein
MRFRRIEIMKCIHAEDFAISIARRSSKAQIKQKLKGVHPDFAGSSVEFLVAENGRILVSHVSSHLQLQEDSGIADCDILSQGSLSVFQENGHSRVVVRPKCSDLSGTEFLNQIVSKIRAYIVGLDDPAGD